MHPPDRGIDKDNTIYNDVSAAKLKNTPLSSYVLYFVYNTKVTKVNVEYNSIKNALIKLVLFAGLTTATFCSTGKLMSTKNNHKNRTPIAPPIIYEIIIYIAEIVFCLKFPESLNKTPKVTAPLK